LIHPTLSFLVLNKKKKKAVPIESKKIEGFF
jgi:hypothetical protein